MRPVAWAEACGFADGMPPSDEGRGRKKTPLHGRPAGGGEGARAEITDDAQGRLLGGLAPFDAKIERRDEQGPHLPVPGGPGGSRSGRRGAVHDRVADAEIESFEDFPPASAAGPTQRRRTPVRAAPRRPRGVARPCRRARPRETRLGSPRASVSRSPPRTACRCRAAARHPAWRARQGFSGRRGSRDDPRHAGFPRLGSPARAQQQVRTACLRG